VELPPRGSVSSTTNYHWQMKNVPYKSHRGDLISICIYIYRVQQAQLLVKLTILWE
jgi:hypothetical protein